MKIKRVLIAIALVSAIVFCTVTSSFALSGSIDCYESYAFVSAHCVGSVSNVSASTGISLAFIPNSPHYPAEDYTCRAVATIEFLNGTYKIVIDTNVCGMSGGSVSSTYSSTPNGARFQYVVNSHTVHDETFGTFLPLPD